MPAARGASSPAGFSTTMDTRSPKRFVTSVSVPPLEAARDPVLDRVLDEGLQEERRHERVRGRRVEVLREAEAVPEAHALDREVAPRERDLLRERDLGPPREAERRPQEVREERAHAARLLGARRRERPDRVEGVEEEVGVQALLEGLELGVAREGLELAPRAPRARLASREAAST